MNTKKSLNKNVCFISNFKQNLVKNKFGHAPSAEGRNLLIGNVDIISFAVNSSNFYLKKESNLTQNIGNQNFVNKNSNNQKLEEKLGSVKNLKKNKSFNSNKEKFNVAYSKVSEVKLITIGLASPMRIRQWAERTLPNGKSVGEVLNANTLHHKTFKPQKGGLFCERIFGPLKDFTCACGKVDKSVKKSWSSRNSELNKGYLPSEINSLAKQENTVFFENKENGNKKGSENKVNEKTGQSLTPLVSDKTIQKNFTRHYCPKCDVEYTWSVVRRYQLGYIKLNSPVTHVWYLKSTPSYLSILLDIKKRNLINTTYCSEILTIERSSKKILKLLDTESPNELFKKWQSIMNKKSNQQNNKSSLNTSQNLLAKHRESKKAKIPFSREEKKSKLAKVNFVKQNLNFLKLIKLVNSNKPCASAQVPERSEGEAFFYGKDILLRRHCQRQAMLRQQFAWQIKKESCALSQFAPLFSLQKSHLKLLMQRSVNKKVDKKYNSLIFFISLILLRKIRLNFNRKINLVNNQLFDSQSLNPNLYLTEISLPKTGNALRFALNSLVIFYCKWNKIFISTTKALINYNQYVEKSLLNLTNVKRAKRMKLKENSSSVTNPNFYFFLLCKKLKNKRRNLPISLYIVLKEEKMLQKQASILKAIEKNWVSICQKAYLNAVFKINSFFEKNSLLISQQNLSSTNSNLGLLKKEIFCLPKAGNNILFQNSEASGFASVNFSKKLKSLFEIVKNAYQKHIKYMLKNLNNSNISLNYITTGELTNQEKIEQFILRFANILNTKNSTNKLSVLSQKQNTVFSSLLTEMFVEQLLLSQYFVKKEDNFYSFLLRFASLTREKCEKNALTRNISREFFNKNYKKINFAVFSNPNSILSLRESRRFALILYYSKLLAKRSHPLLKAGNRTVKLQNFVKPLNTTKEKNIFFTKSYNKISSDYLNLTFSSSKLVSNFLQKEFGESTQRSFSSLLNNSKNLKTPGVLILKKNSEASGFASSFFQNSDASLNKYLYNKVLLSYLPLAPREPVYSTLRYFNKRAKRKHPFPEEKIPNSYNTLDRLPSAGGALSSNFSPALTNSFPLEKSAYAALDIFNTPTLRYLAFFSKKMAPFAEGRQHNQLPKEKKNIINMPNLVNNCYSLSHRETWEGDQDWQIFAIYSSNLPSYAVFNNSQNSFFEKKEAPLYENSDLFSHDRTIPAYNYRFLNSGEHIFGDFNSSFPSERYRYNNLNVRTKFTQETKTSANFSGPGIVNLLLEEFSFSSLKKLDKQNRILLYQLNKNISFYKKNLTVCLSKKKKSSILKLLRDFTKKRDSLFRRTKLIRKLFRKETDPRSMILTLLPVLPPDLRPIVKMGSQIAASDLNRLYQRVIYRNDRLKKFLKDSSISNSYSMKYAQRLLQEAVDNLIQNGKSGVVSEKDSRGRLLKSLSDILKGKQGRFRQYLLGKRVDYSGRSVIVVGPKLKIHECGIPKEMALELYLPFLLKAILVRKKARTVIGAKTFIKTNPTFTWELLREIMQLTPVLLNRAPTLHRLGIQAFQPRLVEGRAILLHPLVCPAFNADFDGDQMAVHVPITVEARAEAWKLMLSRNNFLSPATGEPLAIPSQDMVLGCYYLTTYGNKWAIKHQRGSGFYFNNLMDVIKAYNQQRLDIHALIWIKWDLNNDQIESGTEREEPREIRISKFGTWQEIKPKSYNTYSSTNNLNSQYICTTPGRILFNMILQKFAAL